MYKDQPTYSEWAEDEVEEGPPTSLISFRRGRDLVEQSPCKNCKEPVQRENKGEWYHTAWNTFGCAGNQTMAEPV